MAVDFHGATVTQTSFQLKEAYFVRYAVSRKKACHYCLKLTLLPGVNESQWTWQYLL